MLKQTTVFNVSFHLRAIFKMSFGNLLILPAALSDIVSFWNTGVFLCCERCPCRSLSLTCTVVGGRRSRPNVAVVDGRRFRPTSEHLESTSMFLMLIQQQSEPLVEDWNMLTTIRTIGRRVKSVVGCEQIFLRVDGSFQLACTFPRPSVDVNHNQLYSEMRNDRPCFF